MKNFFYLIPILFVLSCSTSEINDERLTFESGAKEFNSKITVDDLLIIQDSLLKTYAQNPVDDKSNLNEVIIRLDSITFINSEFQNLKIINYSLPTSIEIETLINNYNFFYQNLNVSVDCKYILDLLISNQIDLDGLHDIIISKNINEFETRLLLYVSTNLDEDKDPEWKKNKTVLIVNGYLKQPASAVFNSCLFEIIN